MTGASANGDGGDRHARVAIIGAGFSGIGMAARLLADGIDDFYVLERADEVGGTWRDNTYPGCQCDIPSALYSFSFAPNPEWSRVYPLQSEIRDYLRRVARRARRRPPHPLRPRGQRRGVGRGREALAAARPRTGELTANVLVAAMGGLSEPAPPEIPGLDRFGGTMFHSAEWDHDHDLTGERVAVIGTGASAIQIVPEIQPQRRLAAPVPAHARRG